MGLFDKLKSQALNSISELANNLQEKVDEAKRNLSDSPNNQSNLKVNTPPSSSQSAKLVESKEPAKKETGSGIYGDQMENLIEMALIDGELTEKEKQILFKKASSMGIDLDEFEMILDAKLYEKQRSMKISTNTSQTTPKSGENLKANTQSGIDKYPSKLKTIMNIEASNCLYSEHLINKQKDILLNAAKEYPDIDTYQLLIDAESLKKKAYDDHQVEQLCNNLKYADVNEIYETEQEIMNAKLNYPNNPKVMNAVAIAEIALKEKKEKKGR